MKCDVLYSIGSIAFRNSEAVLKKCSTWMDKMEGLLNGCGGVGVGGSRLSERLGTIQSNALLSLDFASESVSQTDQMSYWFFFSIHE